MWGPLAIIGWWFCFERKRVEILFEINGIAWGIAFVPPGSPHLRRSDGSLTHAVTDWNDRTVYVSMWPSGAYLRKIICHELCHCFCFSFNIHMPIEQEEYLADWVSRYGEDLIWLLDDLMRNIVRKVA